MPLIAVNEERKEEGMLISSRWKEIAKKIFESYFQELFKWQLTFIKESFGVESSERTFQNRINEDGNVT